MFNYPGVVAQPILRVPDQFRLADEKCLFSVIGTGTIRSNSEYKVVVALHRAEKACTFKVTLCGTIYEDSKIIEVSPHSIETLIFGVPQLRPGRHEIRVEGLTGISYKNLHELNVLDEKPIVLIQTDKAAYKPGDLVQFRAVFLDDRTCPYVLEEPITIAIIDGEQNHLKQWKDIQVKKGVYSGNYQLSEQPVLGKWKIEVTTKKGNLESKSFQVEKYVLPKFNVKIETAKNVAFSDGVIKVTVRSKYTYGKNVKGEAVITVAPLKALVAGFATVTKPQKTIQVDGKGETEFLLDKDLNIEANLATVLQLEVVVVMEEELTGNKQEAKEIINVHPFRYKIKEFDTKFVYEIGKPWTANVAIKHVDDTPVLDNENPVKLVIEKQHTLTSMPYNFTLGVQPNNAGIGITNLSATLNEQGIATFEHTFTDNNDFFYVIFAVYQDYTVHLGRLVKKPMELNNKELLKIKELTTRAQLGENVRVLVESDEDMPYFVYTLVGRGKVLKSELITLAQNKKREHIIEFAATFEMMPQVVLFVHFVIDNKLHFKEQKISLKQEFQNKISIEAPAEAKPSEEIALEIETARDSYVGLLGVDQSVLLLREGNDLERDVVFEKLSYYTSKIKKEPFLSERQPGELSGLIMLGNVWAPRPAPRGTLFGAAPVRANNFGGMNAFGRVNSIGSCASPLFGGMPSKGMGTLLPPPTFTEAPVVQIRKEFPENWIFEDIESIHTNKIQLKKKVPDTITSWVLTGFAVSPNTGLAITKQPTLVKTFRPFFIGTNLPYSIKRGEIISIPVLIFNYMDQALDVEITIENADDEFDFVDNGEVPSKRIKRLKVAANNGGTVDFKICPKIIGEVTLKITAISALAGDAIHKKLKVEAEGITIYKNRDYYLHVESGSHKHNHENTVKLDIPEDMVPDSEFVEVSLMGNILSSTITNIDKLVRLPIGCGEQNMINFVPNIMVLRYLECVHKLSPNIERQAKQYLEIGYQRELTYKHQDGSFSAFGKSDRAGSTWLTAYVMRSFHQAKKYIDISNKILEDGLNFLAKTQFANGSFIEVGRVVDFAHMSDLGLTAFVLLAFLENHEAVDKHKDTIERGFEYLQQNVKNSEDLYAVSIAFYALQQRNLPIVHELLAKLETLAHTKGGHKWWTKRAVGSGTIQSLRSESHDVEITGYILMTLLDLNVAVMPITKWLISQRSSNGGFSSTQETVVGLWALIKFAEKSGAADPDMCIEIKAGIESSIRKMHVNNDNAMDVQKVELPKQTRDISFHSRGVGTAIFQISYQYNILEKVLKPSFKLNSTVKLDKKLTVEVTAEFTPILGEQCSNMVIMEVVLPSGFTALKEHFEKIKQLEGVKRVESKHEDTVVMIYFANLIISQPKIITIEAEASHEITGQKPAAITIYDYYDKQKCDTDFYQI